MNNDISDCCKSSVTRCGLSIFSKVYKCDYCDKYCNIINPTTMAPSGLSGQASAQGNHICPPNCGICEFNSPKHKLTDSEKYTKILEWVYCEDGNFGSKSAWRKEFSNMLKETIFN